MVFLFQLRPKVLPVVRPQGLPRDGTGCQPLYAHTLFGGYFTPPLLSGLQPLTNSDCGDFQRPRHLCLIAKNLGSLCYSFNLIGLHRINVAVLQFNNKPCYILF